MNMANAIQSFHDSFTCIKRGPEYICTCCDQCDKCDTGDNARSQSHQHNMLSEAIVSSSLVTCAEDNLKQYRFSFNIKVLKKAKDSLPRIKAGSHNTKQAICMLLWQDIAVLVDTAVWLLS